MPVLQALLLLLQLDGVGPLLGVGGGQPRVRLKCTRPRVAVAGGAQRWGWLGVLALMRVWVWVRGWGRRLCW